MSGGANASSGFIYAIRDEGTLLVKIGMTGVSAFSRLAQLQSGTPYPLTLIAVLPVSKNLPLVERHIHGFLQEWHHGQEWFDTSMHTRKLEQLVEQALFAIAEDALPPRLRKGHRICTIVGMQLRRLRSQKNLSVDTLSRKASVPLHTLARLEMDLSYGVHESIFYRLAHALDVTYLFLTESPG